MTLADIFLVPELHATRRLGVDPAPFPTRLCAAAACALLGEFQSAHPNVEPDHPCAP